VAKAKFKRVSRAPSVNEIMARIQRAERDVLEDIGDLHVKKRENVVRNFSKKTKPKFSRTVKSKSKGTTLTVEVKEVNENKPIWKWLDETGTEPHPISPKKAKALKFTWGGKGSYRAKTYPNPARWGGPGVVQNGKTVFRREVQHPGFPARHFSDEINKDMEKVELKLIRGLRDDIKRAIG